MKVQRGRIDAVPSLKARNPIEQFNSGPAQRAKLPAAQVGFITEKDLFRDVLENHRTLMRGIELDFVFAAAKL